MAVDLKYRNGACSVIEHTVAERNGIVMSRINDDFIGEFRALDFSNNVAGICFALFLFKCKTNDLCAFFNHRLCVIYMNADCGENALFCHRRAKHTLVKIIAAFFVTEVACHTDKCERTGFYKLFKSVCIDAAGEEHDLALY